jgi:hypothetical protein
MHGVAEVEPVWQQEEVAAHGVVDDEPRDEPRDVPVVWTSLGPLPRWVPGPTTRWAPGTTRLVPHGT